jgi:RND family efflux transporter MFP subunit
MKDTLIRIGIVAAILVVGVVAAMAIIRARPEAVQTPPDDSGVLVEVAAVERLPRRIDVEAQGTVLPAQRVVVQPQVSGRIATVMRNLAPGTILREGDLIFAIEDADFKLAVARATAAVSEAVAQLELEQGRGRVAEREWELFQDELDAEQMEASLALREPQLRSRLSALQTARANLARARLDLERTVVRSPFNAVVLAESIEVGQTVTPQSQAVTLAGTDTFWVRAAVRTEELDQLRVPALHGDVEGSRALVRLDPEQNEVLSGRVVRLLGDLDTAGRMARVLVEVRDPLDLEGGRATPGRRGLLLLDSYVDLLLEGAQVRRLFEVPRDWLQEGGHLWLSSGERLEMRPVDVAWRFEDSVCIEEGLSDGELVVTSRLATPIEGMKLRRVEDASPVVASQFLSAASRWDVSAWDPVTTGAAP